MEEANAETIIAPKSLILKSRGGYGGSCQGMSLRGTALDGSGFSRVVRLTPVTVNVMLGERTNQRPTGQRVSE